MHVGPNNIERAARSLQTALNFVQDAASVEMPLLFGRRAATDLVRSNLENAADQADRAASELDQLGEPLRNAADAARQLRDRTEATRALPSITRTSLDELRGAIDDAHGAVGYLRDVSTGLAAAHDGSVSTWLTNVLAPEAITPSRLDSARAVASSPDAVGIDAMVRKLLERTRTVDDHDALAVAREAVTSGGDATARSLLARLAQRAGSGDAIDAHLARIALDGRSGSDDALAMRVPASIANGGSSEGLSRLDAAWLRVAASSPTTADADARIATLLDAPGPLDDDSAHELVVLADARGLSDDLHATLRSGASAFEHTRMDEWASRVRASGTTSSVVDELLSRGDSPVDAAHRLARLGDELLGDAATPQWREQMLERLASTDDPATAEVLRRASSVVRGNAAPDASVLTSASGDAARSRSQVQDLAVLAVLPEDRVPAELAGAADALLDAVRTGSRSIAGDVRRSLERSRLLEGGTGAVEDEVLRLVTKPVQEIDHAAMERLLWLTQLSKELGGRPLIRANGYSLDQAVSQRLLPASDHDARAIVNRVRAWAAGGRIDADPSITKQTLRDEVIAIATKADADITQADMDRLALISELVGSKRPNLPSHATNYTLRTIADNRWLPSNDTDARKEIANLRRWIQHNEITNTPTITRQSLTDEVVAIATKADEQITQADMDRLALISELVGSKRPNLPSHATNYTLRTIADNRWLPSNDTDARKEIANLRRWIQHNEIAKTPTITRQSLTDEVVAIATKADEQITQADMDRLALISELVGSKRPNLPSHATNYTLRTIADNRWLPSNDTDARKEIANLRRWIQHNEIAKTPTITRQSLTDEVVAIATKADEQITQADMDRLALISELVGSKRPNLPSHATNYTLRTIADNRWLPSNDTDARKEIANLRRWIQHNEIAKTPTITRQSLTDEVVAIATKADEQITQADMDRLALISELVGSKRPNLPSHATNYTLRTIADNRWLPSNDTDARKEIANLRRWAFDHSDAAVAIVVERVRAGEPLSPTMLRALAPRAGVLEQLGIERAQLLVDTLRNVRTSTDRGGNASPEDLVLARDLATGIDSSDASASQLRSLVTTAIDSMVASTSGRGKPGYGNRIDDADLGRALSGAELLARARALQNVPAPLPAAATDATGSFVI